MPVLAPPFVGTVLFVVSAAREVDLEGGQVMAAGYWAPEVVLPYEALTRAGFRVQVATPGGRSPTPDPVSLGEGEAMVDLRARLGLVRELEEPLALAQVEPTSYAAIYFPGGYAPMADLSASAEVARVLRVALEHDILVAAICHAPAALLSLYDPGKPWPFAGYRMVSFTDEEEAAWLGARRLPWTVEDRLRKAGATFVAGPVWTSTVVRDRNLLTGQSSPSTGAFTEALLEALGQRTAPRAPTPAEE